MRMGRRAQGGGFSRGPPSARVPGFAQAALTHTPFPIPLPLRLPHPALTSLGPLSQSVSLSPVQRETGPHCLGCLLRHSSSQRLPKMLSLSDPRGRESFPQELQSDPGWSEGPGTRLPAMESFLCSPGSRSFLRSHFLSASCKTACFLLGRET